MQVFRKLLFPFSVLYGMVVYIRNRFYDWNIFKSKSYKTPIFCVGNLSVGGTGKTPMVELIISILMEKYKVAVLSRGYKRKSTGFLLANTESSVVDLGDEPFQIASKFKDCIVAVDSNRQNGIEILERDINPDVILLDDAFQHRKVKPNLSILLTSFNKLYVSDWYLPSGDLRDNPKEATRATVIVVTKMPRNCNKEQRLKIKKKLKIKDHQTILFSYLAYNTQLSGDGPHKNISDLKNLTITLVTGIADASPLLAFLDENGIHYEHLKFKDHHNFTAKDLGYIQSKSNIITTEKDYMRLSGSIKNCNYIAIKHAFFEEGKAQLEERLQAFIPF